MYGGRNDFGRVRLRGVHPDDDGMGAGSTLVGVEKVPADAAHLGIGERVVGGQIGGMGSFGHRSNSCS